MMFQTPEGRVLFLPFATWAHKNVALCLTPVWQTASICVHEAWRALCDRISATPGWQKHTTVREPNLANENGLLRYLVAETYTTQSLAKIKEVLAAYRTHEILPVANGLFAASSSQAPDSVTGYQNVCIRDNIMVADSLRLRCEFAPTIACMHGLTKFYSKQLPRFRELVDDSARVLREDANRRPHIRFTAQTLDELPGKWPHAQNDALGHALWFRFLLANTGILPLSTADYEIYLVFPAYFEAIEYWKDKDSGSWEEGRKINNSSVGAVVAGLQQMRKYHDFQAGSAQQQRISLSPLEAEKLSILIAKGHERLDSALPFESPAERMADSALLFQIHPLEAVRTRELEDTILNLVQGRLKGHAGIKRMPAIPTFARTMTSGSHPNK
jgi:Glycosyl hydrolases family 15